MYYDPFDLFSGLLKMQVSDLTGYFKLLRITVVRCLIIPQKDMEKEVNSLR